MKQKRILIVGDCPTLNSGYARIGRFVASALHKAGYYVRYLPGNATVPNSERTFEYDVDKFDPHDRYNNRRIADILMKYRPSLCMVFGEFAYVGYIGNVCRQYNVRALHYLPVEGLNYPPHIAHFGGGYVDYRLTLAKFHHIIAYSNFGKEQIHKQLPGIVQDCIPHSVDTAIFRPLDKKECRSIYFPDFVKNPSIGNEGFFIVGCVARNMRRKGIDYLFKAFKHFKEKYERKERKVYLYGVMDPRDSYGYNLVSMIEQLGLKGSIIIVPNVIGAKQGPGDNALSEIYNCMDVACYPFRAEGFGLPILEGLACGVRTICTDFATPGEFAKDVATLIKPWDYEPIHGTNCEWAVLDYREFGEALGKVYNEEDTRTWHLPSVERARQYDDAVVTKRWVQLMDDLQLPDVPDIPDKDKKPEEGSAAELVDSYLDAIES